MYKIDIVNSELLNCLNFEAIIEIKSNTNKKPKL